MRSSRRVCFFAVAVAAAVVAGCGGTSSSTPQAPATTPPETPTSPPPETPTTTPPGTTTPGTSAPGTTAPPPSGTPPDGAGGGTAPPAAAGQPPAATGTPSCAAFASTALPAQQHFTLSAQDVAPDAFCGDGVVDADGALAFLTGVRVPRLWFVAADGRLRRDQDPASFPTFLFPMSSGFFVYGSGSTGGPVRAQGILAYTTLGERAGSTLFAGGSVAASFAPRPGALLAGALDLEQTQFNSKAPSLKPLLAAFGPDGQVAWSAPLASPSVEAIGVDGAGNVLVAMTGAASVGAGNLAGQWFGPDGKTLTGEFLLAKGWTGERLEVTRAAAGGVLLATRSAAGAGAKVLAVVASGADHADAPPAWMTSRSDATLRAVRGGSAYAWLSHAATGTPCARRVDLVGADGAACGHLDVPVSDGACSGSERQLALGLDGTLVVTDANAAPRTCAWRWWPGALR